MNRIAKSLASGTGVLLLSCMLLQGQPTTHGLTTLGAVDVSGAATSKSMKVGTAAPSSTDCDAAGEVGRLYMKADAPATSNTQIYKCQQTGSSAFAWNPISHVVQDAAPAKCITGELWFDSNATAGQNWYGCTAADTWTLQGDGAGGGSGDLTEVQSSDSDYIAVTSGTGPVPSLAPGAQAVKKNAAQTWTQKQTYSAGVNLLDETTGAIASDMGISAAGYLWWHNGASAVNATYGATGMTADAPICGSDGAAGIKICTSPTGTGSVVLATSPTLTTPVLGVAAATSVNKVAITAPATGSTLTIAEGKTLTASNTLALTGTDSSSVAFGAGGTVMYTNTSVQASQLPALTGDVTTSAGAVATTIATSAVTPAKMSAQAQNGSYAYCADAGSTDTYACTLTPAPGSYVTGGRYLFKANTANTGAATVNFNAIGAATVKKVAGGVTTDLADNDIRANQIVEVVYDGTNMQMASQLGNAGSVSSAVPVCAIYPVAYTAVTAGALTNDVTLFTLPARGKIVGLTIKPSTLWTHNGGALSTLTVSIGLSGNTTAYTAPYTVMTGPSGTGVAISDTAMQDDGGHYSATFASHAVLARFTSTGANLDSLNAGALNVWACTVVLP